jgi:hypothetical protein
MKRQKIGVQCNISKSDCKQIARHMGKPDFVSVVDGVTFGVLDGHTFHSGPRDWSVEHQTRWAVANAAFFQALADNLTAYQRALTRV